ncbi:MAG: hypothetical protein MJB14_03830 [Spirochaetes bacterium]|nr:hypothetical protein [Spirochaetota bacterium]
MKKQDFMKKYPVSLQDLIISPSVFRENFPFAQNLPYPGLHHLRDICEYANYTYGALRTSVSRIIKAKSLDFFFDEKKTKRFRLTKTQQNVSEVLSADIGDTKDFSIVIFSFSTAQEKQRRDARFLLQAYGFRLFAQNTYIRSKIKKAPFENSLREYGLINNVFIFDCLDPKTVEFKKRLLSQFEMEKRQKQINTFYADLNQFLPADLDAVEFSRRLIYAGPVYYNICFANAIPIPENYFSEKFLIKELKQYFNIILEKRGKDFSTYYLNIENQGAKR